MSLIDFPDPRDFEYSEWIRVGNYLYPVDGIVHFGGELNVENLQNAYRAGIFPWYTPGIPLPWHCPDPRAIIEFTDLHIPRSLEKARRSSTFIFSIDKDFASVIKACSGMKRPDQPGTWITDEFVRAYCELHDARMAHSVETWDAEGNLVGGLYGVDAGGVFCGESMFYTAPNASKLALLFLIDHLRSRGSTWLDAQVMTPHMQILGAKEIPRPEFLSKLEAARSLANELFPRNK